MSDGVRFLLQIGLNVLAIVLAAWLASHYVTRRLQRMLEAERQAAEQALRKAQAELLAGLPPIPPQVEQMVAIERWLLTARDLQVVLSSIATLLRLQLRADEETQQAIFAESERLLKSLERQEKKWLDPSLQIIAFARQLDPARGNMQNQTLERWISRLNQGYVQAAQSLRRAASLCQPDGGQGFNGTLANSYLAEGDQSNNAMMNAITSGLDRLSFLRDQLPAIQAQRMAQIITYASPTGQSIASGVSE